MKQSILYCGQLESGEYLNFYSHPDLVKMCGHDEIFKVRMSEVAVIPDVSARLEKDPDGYFAWWDEEDGDFTHAFPSLHQVEICFPYGSKAEAELGRGNIYEVKLEVLGETK